MIVVQGQVSRPFDDDLDPLGPGPFGELTQDLEFVELGPVGGVGQAAGAQAVPQRQGDVVFPGDLEQPVVVLVQGVFLLVAAHPGGEKGAAPGDHPGDPFFQQGESPPGNAAVHRDEVHPLFGVVVHHVQEVVGLDVIEAGGLGHHLVDGHGAEGRRALGQKRGANLVQVAAGGQVHDRVGPVLQGRGQLGLLLLQTDVVGRSADIGVDLDPDPGADGRGFKSPVLPVGRHRDGAQGQPLADKLRSHAFAGRGLNHGWSDFAR